MYPKVSVEPPSPRPAARPLPTLPTTFEGMGYHEAQEWVVQFAETVNRSNLLRRALREWGKAEDDIRALLVAARKARDEAHRKAVAS